MPSKVTSFFCDSCGKKYKSLSGASKHEVKCLKAHEEAEALNAKKNELCNRTRLTCDNVHNLARMIEADIKEIHGKTISISFSNWHRS